METDTADDWGAFAGSEHMFFGLQQPFTFIRTETEASLRKQVPDTVLEAIKTFDTPKFLTLGRKTSEGRELIVTHFAFSAKAQLHVAYDGGRQREIIDAAFTFLFGDMDHPGAERSRSYFDFCDDVQSAFDDEVFKNRFLEFRLESVDEPNDTTATIVPKAKPWWQLWA